MKDFLSEYGFAILAAIVVILLIAMCTPVGNLIKNQVMDVVDSFAAKTEAKLYTADAGNETAIILKQLDDNGKFSIVATTDSETDVLKASYKVKDQFGNWTDWKELGQLSTGSKEHADEFTAKIENGNRAQVRVTNEGKADSVYFESNIVEYTGQSSQTESVISGVSFTPEVMPSEKIEVLYANEFDENGEELYEDFGQDILLVRSEEEANEALIEEMTVEYYEALNFSSNIDYGIVQKIFCYYKLIDEIIPYNIPEGNYWDIVFYTYFRDEEILCILLNNEELEPENWTITDNGELKIKTSYGHGSIIIVTEEKDA